MDPIVYTRRLVKGSSLTHAEGDENLDVTQTALEQLDTETVKVADVEDITDTLSTLADNDVLAVRDTSDAGALKESTIGAIRAPLVTRLDDIDDLLVGLEAAIEAIL